MTPSGRPGKPVDEMRQWLSMAQGYPGKRASVLSRVRHAPARLVPALVFLATHEGPPIGRAAARMLGDLVAAAEDLPAVLNLHRWLPDEGAVLATAGARATQKLIGFLPLVGGSATEVKARLLYFLSEELENANQPEEAFRCAERAVKLSRRLPIKDSGCRKVRAFCLLALCRRQAARGMGQSALKSATEARTLVEQCGFSSTGADLSLPGFVLTTYADRLVAVGRLREAVASAKRALSLWSQSPRQTGPQANVAFAEQVLAKALTHLGQHAAALPHSDRADRLYRAVIGDEPDAYAEFAAEAASTYALNLWHTGDLQRCYAVARINVDRGKEWAKRQPTRFGFQWVIHLLEFASFAADYGGLPEAVSHATQAVGLARKLGSEVRKRDWSLESRAHASLADLNLRLQNPAAAAQAARTALLAARRLAAAHPEALPRQVMALRHLAEAQRQGQKAGSQARALRTARQGVNLLDAALGPADETVLNLQALCRTTAGFCLEDLGRIEEAIAEERKSLGLWRQLNDQKPEVYRTDFAQSHLYLAGRLLRTKQTADALREAKESIAHFQIAVRSAGDRHLPHLAAALNALALIQAARTDILGAIKTFIRAIRLLRPYYTTTHDFWLPHLKPLCTSYVKFCRLAGIDFDPALIEGVVFRR